MSDLKELLDCAAGVTSAISSCSSSGKSAERQFGDSGIGGYFNVPPRTFALVSCLGTFVACV